ncbi:MAG: hypothetical protein G01um10143_846 [Parcubacteria group bacterium Gr01-1014_3]|nr:MAG: hypothetical protein G01um10143_846 [Parcubacteria group bacterium Gr01-1014_3]
MFNYRKAIIIFSASAGVLFLMFFVFGLRGVHVASGNIVFRVNSGDGFREIAASLEQQRLIRSPIFFKLYSVLTGSAHRFKPGSYELNSNMSGAKIVSVLVRGPKEDVEIVVTEGEDLLYIDKKLSASNVLPAKALRNYQGKSLEGFLFPDTYRFFPSTEVDDVVGRFLNNFYKKAMPELVAADNVYQALIVASMIEKEVPFDEDRPLVAGIIYRRLAIDMPLQIDATVDYAKEVGNSKYDTYQYYGLPPTPISNPGLSAIRAAVHPQKSDYLYYLSDPKTKKTIFSKNFEEHKENKWKYLRK